MARTISPTGVAFIKRWEGLRLATYLCEAGVPTIGYGHTGRDVRDRMTITEPDAEMLLCQDLARFERGVDAMLPGLHQHRFDAVVSLAFNIGLGNITGSTLVRKVKAGDYKGAAEQFDVWRMVTIHIGGKPVKTISPGLVKRRAAERAMFQGLA